MAEQVLALRDDVLEHGDRTVGIALRAQDGGVRGHQPQQIGIVRRHRAAQGAQGTLRFGARFGVVSGQHQCFGEVHAQSCGAFAVRAAPRAALGDRLAQQG